MLKWLERAKLATSLSQPLSGVSASEILILGLCKPPMVILRGPSNATLDDLFGAILVVWTVGVAIYLETRDLMSPSMPYFLLSI